MKKGLTFFNRQTLYYLAVWVCILLLALNFLRTDDWTGDKEFYEFTKIDWILFYVFLAEEALIIIVTAVVTVIWGRRLKATEEKRFKELEERKYGGLNPGEYDLVWFNFGCTMRAIIMNQDGVKLYVESYDGKTNAWEAVGERAQFDDMEQLKRALWTDYRFICSENYYYKG